MSIRQVVVAHASTFLHRETPSAEDEVFMDAVEIILRGLSDFSSIDGFCDFYILQETEQKIDFVGRTYFLAPFRLIPMEVSFQRCQDGEISYRIILGSDDEIWKSLTEKQRWSSIFLYATEGYAPPWNWNPPVTGKLTD